jgi:hypothetical protein
MNETRLIVILLAVLVLLSIARGLIVDMVMEGHLPERDRTAGGRSDIAACQTRVDCPTASRPQFLN